MRTPQSQLHNDSAAIKRLIARGSDEIMRRCEEAVRAERAAPAIEGAETPQLLESLPPVLAEILGVIGSGVERVGPKKTGHAAVHGRERARQHLDVRDLMLEYQALRRHIFLYLQEHAAQFEGLNLGDMVNVFRRVGLAVDEAMCETLSAFVEEKIGGLRHLSRTDSLTGLYNHRTFYERLDEELKRAARYEAPLSVVLIDLDDFKTVNDMGGHQFGDSLLIQCAALMRRELRQTDIICRYGGDEFSVIMPETAGGAARSMMRRLSDAFIKLGERVGAPAAFGMSFGLSTHPEDDGMLTRLVKLADERLLLNKRVKKSAPALIAHPQSTAEAPQAVRG
jgi:diguanylate cyclase (GGDEF)-like protein